MRKIRRRAAACRTAPRGRACKRRLHVQLQSHSDVRLHLFTDHPLHIAAGSMPSQNGFGLGGAFVWTKNTRNWRLSWDADAIGAISGGAWRAGGYMKLIHTPHPTKPVIEVVIPTPGEKPKASEKKKSQHRLLTLHGFQPVRAVDLAEQAETTSARGTTRRSPERQCLG